MTWLWLLPLLVLAIGLAGVAIIANRAAAEVVVVRLRTAELRSLHEEIQLLRRESATVIDAAARLQTPVLRAAPGADSHHDPQ